MAVGLVFLDHIWSSQAFAAYGWWCLRGWTFEHDIRTISDDLMWACIMKLHQSSTWALGQLSDSKPPELEFCSYPD